MTNFVDALVEKSANCIMAAARVRPAKSRKRKRCQDQIKSSHAIPTSVLNEAEKLVQNLMKEEKVQKSDLPASFISKWTEMEVQLLRVYLEPGDWAVFGAMEFHCGASGANLQHQFSTDQNHRSKRIFCHHDGRAGAFYTVRSPGQFGEGAAVVLPEELYTLVFAKADREAAR